MPAVGLVGALVVIMIGDERAGGLGFFFATGSAPQSVLRLRLHLPMCGAT